MNTKKIKEVGKWLMVAGGSIFTSGAGCYFVGNYIERKEEKYVHRVNMNRIEEEDRISTLKLKEEKMKAEAEKDRQYCLKINQMNNDEFAKFHAENVAKANDEVIKDAERVKMESKTEMIKLRLKCNEQIDKIREECLKKIESANKERDEAVEKYEAIDTLFTNKNEILKAKYALEKAIQEDKETKSNKEELLENIKDLLS